MLLQKLENKGLIHPPPFLITNCSYLTVMGSIAYGVADTNNKAKTPDMDVYGFCIPPKDYLFPNLRGEIPGFGTPGPKFNEWSQHHIFDADAHSNKGQEYDFTVFSIVKFFELCRQGNPNMLDSLFTREECVLHCTPIGRMVRDNRKLFISKEIWARFRGYSFQQMHKMQGKECKGIEHLKPLLDFEVENNISRKTSYAEVEKELKNRSQKDTTPGSLTDLSERQLTEYHQLYFNGVSQGNRFELIKMHGFDTKYAYHILRLFDEASQLLETGEMDLQRAKEAMKSIRRGEWSVEEVIEWAKSKEKELELAFTNCKLPAKADEEALKKVLLNCLEHHYGNLDKAFAQPQWAQKALKSIDDVLNQVRKELYSG